MMDSDCSERNMVQGLLALDQDSGDQGFLPRSATGLRGHLRARYFTSLCLCVRCKLFGIGTVFFYSCIVLSIHNEAPVSAGITLSTVLMFKIIEAQILI